MKNKEDRSIGKWISIIHRQSQTYLNNELRQYDINSSEYIYLVNLASNEGVNQKFLSDMLCVDEALTTRVIRNLEKKNYVVRERDSDDRRAYNVRLTEKGKKIQPIIVDKLKYWTAILSTGMNIEQIDYIIDNLMSMANNAIITNRGEKNEKN